jgi:GT2 family glycosyltransferase
MHELSGCRSMPDLSIIIVCWNSTPDLQRCLPALPGACREHVFEVILIDNDSADDPMVLGRSLLPDAVCLRNNDNAGFASANNQGIGIARGRYVVLLNPDTVAHEGAFDRLLEFMDGNPGVWACGPALLNGDGSPQRTGVRFPTVWNLLVEALFLDRLFPESRLFGRHRELYADMQSPRQVDFVQGSCLLVRRSAIETVGGLDESFFMYFEETDWCKRAQHSGGEVWIVPAARVIHFGGGAFAHYDERRLVNYHVSLFLYFHKHAPWWKGLMVRAVVACRSLIRLIIWTGIAVTSAGGLRTKALSSVKGYLRTCRLVFRFRVPS